MSYVARTLGARERVLFRTGYHWLVWVGALWLMVPVAFVAVGGYPFGALDYSLLVLCLIPALIGLYYFARTMLVEIVVTNERFVYKTGLIAFRTEEIALDNIETIGIEQSILGRLLGYGTIEVHGTGSERVAISMVSDPVGLRRHIPMAPEAVGEGAELAA